MEFKAKRRVMTVTIDETKYSVKFPTLGELDVYRQELKKADAGEDLLSGFIENLGLPKDAQMMLEPSDLTEIVQLLTDQKKA